MVSNTAQKIPNNRTSSDFGLVTLVRFLDKKKCRNLNKLDCFIYFFQKRSSLALKSDLTSVRILVIHFCLVCSAFSETGHLLIAPKTGSMQILESHSTYSEMPKSELV